MCLGNRVEKEWYAAVKMEFQLAGLGVCSRAWWSILLDVSKLFCPSTLALSCPACCLPWSKQLFSNMPSSMMSLPWSQPADHGVKLISELNFSSFKMQILGIVSLQWETWQTQTEMLVSQQTRSYLTLRKSITASLAICHTRFQPPLTFYHCSLNTSALGILFPLLSLSFPILFF